ncbi:hypothetical protein Lal_00001914 [Lupinus albus]|nr:hypothetical protein Lal_00001914 [Lupinus albus]
MVARVGVLGGVIGDLAGSVVLGLCDYNGRGKKIDSCWSLDFSLVLERILTPITMHEKELLKVRIPCAFEGFKIGRGGVEMCDLQFADDTIIVCKLSHKNLWYMKTILRSFESTSSLKSRLFQQRQTFCIIRLVLSRFFTRAFLSMRLSTWRAGSRWYLSGLFLGNANISLLEGD